jgi:hypothetical protein
MVTMDCCPYTSCWLSKLSLSFVTLITGNRRIYKIFMRKEMTVIKLTDASLVFRLSIGLAFEVMMLGIMQATDPVMSLSAVQSALPRDQTIYYCAPHGITMASFISG